MLKVFINNEMHPKITKDVTVFHKVDCVCRVPRDSLINTDLLYKCNIRTILRRGLSYLTAAYYKVHNENFT